MSTIGAPAVSLEGSKNLTGIRLVSGYAIVLAILAAAIATSITIGHGRHATPALGGFYSSSSTCLGKSFKLVQSGEFLDVSGGASGKLRYRHGRIRGSLDCAGGGAAAVDLGVTGKGTSAELAGTVGAQQATAKFSAALPA